MKCIIFELLVDHFTSLGGEVYIDCHMGHMQNLYNA